MSSTKQPRIWCDANHLTYGPFTNGVLKDAQCDVSEMLSNWRMDTEMTDDEWGIFARDLIKTLSDGLERDAVTS